MTDRPIRAVAGALALVFAGGALGWPDPTAAQSAAEAPGAVDTAVVAGPEYQAGTFQEWLLGRGYRATWTTAARVPILDLDTFAGGLTPTETGGGVQTRSLRFTGVDGRAYNFRSVNKSYSGSMPPWGRGTVLEWLRQDLTSAQHPAGAVVATHLLDAVGILNPGPRLVVMPDDPRLGEHRSTFAGMLGTIEVHPNEGENDEPLFADSRKVAGADRVLEHLDEEPEHRIDAPAFLASRLMSVYLNDWDRHIGQYRFARYPDGDGYRWVVVPEDRDYALVDHDGLLLRVGREALSPRLIALRHEHPDLLAMMANSDVLARRLLAGVDRPTWDSVATSLRRRLTDDAIEEAVAAMPEAWYRQEGPRLARALKARRDRFLEMSAELYDLVASYPLIHGTGEGDIAVIDRHPDGSVTVRLSAGGGSGDGGARTYFDRRFRPNETEEVRVFLSSGDDRATVRGAPAGAVTIRVIGGPGDDVLVDSTGIDVVFYDAEGGNRFEAPPSTRIDRRPFDPSDRDQPLLPTLDRDWGRDVGVFGPAVIWKPDVGLLVGGGPTYTRYGFRHQPYAARHALDALVAPFEGRGALAYTGSLHRENSHRRVALRALASNVDVLRFHGFGNRSPALPDDSALTWYRRYRAEALWIAPVGPALDLEAGGTVSHHDPELEAGTPLATARPVGVEGTTEVGLLGALRHDSRDGDVIPRSGFRGDVELRGFTSVADSVGVYGTAAAAAEAFLPLPLPLGPTLVVGGGAERTLGGVPVHRSAFLGGRDDLRGFSHHRFAGDFAAWGTGGLQLPLGELELVARGTAGVSAFTDAGRVWVDGDSPGDWHTAAGAAAWFASPLYSVSVEYAHGAMDVVYLRIGTAL